MFLARMIYPEIFQTTNFWKNSAIDEAGLIGYKTLAKITKDY
jgi:hypothetical protein